MIAQLLGYGAGELALLIIGELRQRCYYEHRLVDKEWHLDWCRHYASRSGLFRIPCGVVSLGTYKYGIVRDLYIRGVTVGSCDSESLLRGNWDTSGCLRTFLKECTTSGSFSLHPMHVVVVRYENHYAWYIRVAHAPAEGASSGPSCRLMRLRRNVCAALLDELERCVDYRESSLLTTFKPCAEPIRVDPRCMQCFTLWKPGCSTARRWVEHQRALEDWRNDAQNKEE